MPLKCKRSASQDSIAHHLVIRISERRAWLVIMENFGTVYFHFYNIALYFEVEFEPFVICSVYLLHVHHIIQTACFSPDRKSTRLNSSHVAISYAVFCLKKKHHKPWGEPVDARPTCGRAGALLRGLHLGTSHRIQLAEPVR